MESSWKWKFILHNYLKELHFITFFCILLTRKLDISLLFFICSSLRLVVTDTRNQYDGTRRSPWNEIECGDHYTRAMAAFLYFEIAAGMVSSAHISTVSITHARTRIVRLLWLPKLKYL